MELLVCMSISGSIPVVICLLLYVIQRENYNYILGRRLLITGIFFYLIPIQLIKYLIPEEVYPEALFNEEAQLYLTPYLSGLSERENTYGCRNGLILCLSSGLVELLSLRFMKSSNIGEVYIISRISSLKKKKILKTILPII